MMKFAIALPLAVLAALPAHATGGLVCRTAGASRLEVSMGFGHVAGAPLILTRLLDRGRNVAVKPAQWWLDNEEVRLLLIDPGARSQQMLLKARRKGLVYDGSLWRSGKRHWVRCRED